MYVRISRGAFDPGNTEAVERMLRASEERLLPGIRQLPGAVSYYAAIDPASATIVNVSVWETLEDAQRMASFQPMAEMREVFVAHGIQFEPVVNYEVTWNL